MDSNLPDELKNSFKKIDDQLLLEARKKLEKESKDSSEILEKHNNDSFLLNKDFLILAGTIFGSSIALAAGRDVNNFFILGEFFLFLALLSGFIVLITHLKSKEWEYAFTSKNSLESYLLTCKKKVEKFELEATEDLIRRYKALLSKNQSGILYLLLKRVRIERWPIIFNTTFLIGILLILISIVKLDEMAMNIQILNLIPNFDFLSALSGFVGTLMLFFFGLPAHINPDGHINLILEQTDERGAKQYKRYKILSYIALALVTLSFLLQLIKIVINK